MKLHDNMTTYTAKEVAIILKVSKTQVQKLEKAGVLKPIDWGDNLNKNRARRRFIRYTVEAVETFLNGGKKEVENG
ncbi:helix-turn-helix domain-containing protein [Rhizosphaericola mali]|uniref:Helix-turn-helix domain-containing protein n=1 Tax=Rhizosphaericola mali TaxID=2545455 RepID=A0A5P2FZ18_9BACT|nr:helix-turn-helix domain-containing protein [Rhizosphaericola mali]QES87638.1 helix-turn-helix domain-containing protein [Rhizosphaericola mali]